MQLMWRGCITGLSLLLLWQAVVWIGQLPPYILPSPLLVFKTGWVEASVIAHEAIPTIIETLMGLLRGIFLGCTAALTLSFFRPARLWLLPILVISQAIPTFAIAPLLVVWFGYGMASKVATTTIMLFFPVTTAFFDGLRRTPASWIELANTMNATPWQLLWRIKIPAALPSLASGIRVAAAIAPIGAVIGEWVGSSKGLGFLMLNANARMQIDMMFAVLFVITVLTLGLYFAVDWGLKRVVFWEG